MLRVQTERGRPLMHPAGPIAALHTALASHFSSFPVILPWFTFLQVDILNLAFPYHTVTAAGDTLFVSFCAPGGHPQPGFAAPHGGRP